MKDHLPEGLKKGDSLRAVDMDRVYRHVNKFEQKKPGTFSDGFHSGSFESSAGEFNRLTSVAVVSDLTVAEGDSATSGLYKIKLRWFRNSEGKWITDDDKEWIMDERGVNRTPPGYQVGNLIIVYWDEQRDCFVPIVGMQGTVEFMLMENLEQFSGDKVKAAIKVWNPSGDGGYDYDCDNYIYVADRNEVGHEANVGGFGMCKMMPIENDPGVIGVIFDLCCRGDEMGAC